MSPQPPPVAPAPDGGHAAPPPGAGLADRDDAADRACVQAVLNGQRDRFMPLVRRHQSRVHRFLLRHTQHADDAQDLTQDTFFQAYLKLAHWRGDARFSTWLIGIALNLARNHANRSPHLRHGHVALDAQAPALALMAPHEPSQTYAENARHRAMQRAMAALPQALRDPLMLVAMDGVAYDETAVRLGLPMGTLKSRIHRARRQLRSTLAEHL